MITSTYIEGNSFLHKTDPRIKIIILVDLLVLLFVPIAIPVMIFIVVLFSMITAISIGFYRLLIPLKMVLPIVIFILLLTPPFYREGNSLFIVQGKIILTSDGLEQTLRLIMRFSGITVLFFMFFATTTINNFILALQWFRLPYRTALIITIALRYIPYMITVYSNIQDAHKLRITEESGKKLIRRFKRVFPSLVSVLIQSIKSIPTLAMALELRGIGLEIKRTQFNIIKFNKRILQLSIAGVILLMTIWIIRFL